MIPIDFSGVSIAGIMAQQRDFADLDTDTIRHFILNSLRAYRHRYHQAHGELVICCDSRRSWRKDYYPYYKIKRKAARAESPIDWAQLFKIMDQIKQELHETFPYNFLEVDGAEADDVMAFICAKLPGPHMVISNDKDMVQLQRYSGVSIYSPLKKSVMPKINNIEVHIKEHILAGDHTDGIPNVLSDDDVFVNTDKRQSPLRKKRIPELMLGVMDENTMRNYKRNETLIDLTKIPSDIEDKIKAAFLEEDQRKKTRSGIMPYFIKHRLRTLFDNIDQF